VRNYSADKKTKWPVSGFPKKPQETIDGFEFMKAEKVPEVQPTIRSIGRKLQLAELDYLAKRFDLDEDGCRALLTRLEIPLITVGPREFFSIEALEEALTKETSARSSC